MAVKPFKDQVIILTGASIGIGRALALLLADQGAQLVLAARSKNKLEETAHICQARGGEALAIPTDVSNQSQAERLIEQTVEAYGRIDTLVNNAGISMWVHFDEIEDISLLERIMQVNYHGSVYCTYYALPYLKKSKGRLVAVSSLAGKTGVPIRSGYAASKHAVVGFFDTLRIELAEDGISVTIIYPGFVLTEIRKRAFTGNGQPLGVEPIQEESAMTAEECARLIVPAIAARKRELIMTPRGKVGQWLKLIAPGLVDRIARNAIEKGR